MSFSKKEKSGICDEENGLSQPTLPVASSKGRLSRRQILLLSILLITLVLVLGAVLIAIIVPVVLVNSEATPTSLPSFSLLQSDLDLRDYQVVTLDNRLRVLLISDPTTDTSAASMNVATGQFDDPDDIGGLAHFCEHMLFLGTEKYPDDGDFDEFLSQHGGFINAFTTLEDTNYFFTVQAEFLEMALDRLAQFFITPLFTESGVNREINAVNAEFESVFFNDFVRELEVLDSLSDPMHPLSTFGAGNLATLDRPDIRQRVYEFYQSHYSANRMQLVVYGRENLTTLEGYAENLFGSIRDQGINPAPIQATSFSPPFTSRLIYVYPVANLDTLSIYWQAPSLEEKYRNAVAEFITRHLDDAIFGSVLDVLRREDLGISLVAGFPVNTGSYTLFSVFIELTENGLRGVSRVIEIIYRYIALMRNISKEEFVMRFEDFRGMRQTLFDFGERQTPESYAVNIALRMRVVTDAEDFLSSPQRLIPDHTLFLSTLEYLRPDNANIVIGSQTLNIAPTVAEATDFTSEGQPPLNQTGVESGHIPWPSELDRYEPIFKVPYGVIDIPTELLDVWNGMADIPGLSLPEEDQFIAGGLEVLPKPADSPTEPVQLLNGDGVALWWLLDSKDFPEPRVNLECDITSGNALPNPQWEAMNRLFVSNVAAELTSRLYSATEVGYDIEVNTFPRGISLSIEGLSNHDSMRSILSTISEVLLDEGAGGELFEAAKSGYIAQTSNINFTDPVFRYTFDDIQRAALDRPFSKNWELLLYAANLTFSDIQTFASSQLLSDVSILCFAHGNVDRDNAISYMNVLKESFSERLMSGDVVGQFHNSRVQLPPGESYGIAVQTFNPTDENSVVNTVFQVSEVCSIEGSSCSRQSLLARLHLLLLEQMIGGVCFNELRTQQQLGYIVFCFSTTEHGVGSFQVVVQSIANNATEVNERIDIFLADYYNSTLSPTSFDELFQEQVSVLRTILTQRDVTLNGRTERFWTEVFSGQHQFSYNQQLVGIIDEQSQDFSADSMRAFYTDHILSEGTLTRKLVIAVYGQGKEFLVPDNLIPVDYPQLPYNFLN